MRIATSIFALCLSVLALATSHAADRNGETLPTFKVDPAWPLEFPNNWAIGEISGLKVDARGHLWVIHRPGTLTERDTRAARNPPLSKCCIPAPPVIEFDQAGKLVRAWGGPGPGYDWPSTEHGIDVDGDGSIWVGGNGIGPKDTNAPDGMILKFDPSGKFLLQIGGRGVSEKGSLDQAKLGKAADFAIDSAAREIYVADGYTNHRIIVFDTQTGAFKRMWGAYGKPPTDFVVKAGEQSLNQFSNVHCVELSRDDLVYVCDRSNNRIQVFTKAGTFRAEYIYPADTSFSPGSVSDITMSPDSSQSFLFVADSNNAAVKIIRRRDGKELGLYGRLGGYAGQFDRIHEVAMGADGVLYTGEAGTKRVQKFIVRIPTPPKR